MNDTEQEQLQTMLDDIISDKPENVETMFHSFIKTKMQNMVSNSEMFNKEVATTSEPAEIEVNNPATND